MNFGIGCKENRITVYVIYTYYFQWAVDLVKDRDLLASATFFVSEIKIDFVREPSTITVALLANTAAISLFIIVKSNK